MKRGVGKEKGVLIFGSEFFERMAQGGYARHEKHILFCVEVCLQIEKKNAADPAFFIFLSKNHVYSIFCTHTVPYSFSHQEKTFKFSSV
jgi:hypothetical protein